MFNKQGHFNIFSVFSEIKKKKAIFISILLACVAGSYVFSLVVAPKYSAEVTLIPVIQPGEQASNTTISTVTSLLGSSSSSVNIPSWQEATIIMETGGFAKKFLLEKGIMQTIIDENDLGLNWENLNKDEQNVLINELALLWINRYIEIEIEEITNVVKFSVTTSNKDNSVAWVKEYIILINQYMKEFLKEETEHKIAFYRERIEQEAVNDIRNSLISLLTSSIQKKALIDTNEEIVLRTIDAAEIALLRYPILKLNLAIGIFLGLLLGFIFVIFLATYRRYKTLEHTYD